MPAVFLDSFSTRRMRPARRTPSRFAACLERFSQAGYRLVVLSPSDVGACSRGLARFADRSIDGARHERWDEMYRQFRGCPAERHDAASWRILAIDRDDRIAGAITARFFCGEVDLAHLHVLSLLESTGPVLREHCEMAIGEVFGACARARRTPAEISHWAVAPGWHAALVAVTLARAIGALASAFDAPVAILAADNRRGEGSRLMRLGGQPLALTDRFALPPFVHHASGAWVRLLVIDAATYQRRSGSQPAADLALLRSHAPLLSPA